ncbi:hypothetical protein [Aquimarina sp. MMG016]|uniref:hypothetical protein n=1 Tax=Aquimarina sp. MMG016 TaxID=2822690 RepID=UPI001B39E647|nr:hypothetical protein [Aquimarina sp. MMG016]MBQ4820671.1 hypothetical protein [Aquimarina sp. MMG016]
MKKVILLVVGIVCILFTSCDSEIHETIVTNPYEEDNLNKKLLKDRKQLDEQIDSLDIAYHKHSSF